MAVDGENECYACHATVAEQPTISFLAVSHDYEVRERIVELGLTW